MKFFVISEISGVFGDSGESTWPTRNHDHMLYCYWDMVRNRRNLLFFILGYFFPFYLPNSPKTQNSQKMKKIPGDIIILYKRTKNHDHMLHCSWDMVSHGCNYFFILGHFLLFYPPNSPKNQNFTKIKKTLADIIIFYTTASKTKIMFLRYGAWQMYLLFFILGYFLPFHPP